MTILRSLILTFILISTFGCGKHKDSTKNKQQSVTEKYLRISLLSAARSLDPSIGIDSPSTSIVKMLFEGLMSIGLDGKVKPAIAHSYDISADLKRFTFYLRPSKWTNGEELTAYDFEYSWKRIIDPQTDTLGVHNFYPIKNARAAALGEVPLDCVGIKALDAYTLQVDLENPTPYFVEVVATSSYLPVNPRVTKEDSKWANQQGEKFVCNGPFLLKSHRLENEMIVEKNPSYWDADHVYLPGISISIIKDETTQLSLFEKGDLDWVGQPISKIPLDAFNSLKAKNQLHYINVLGVYWYFFNTESFPFHNKQFRKAFAYGIDRDLITKHILQCNETPAMAILPLYLASQKEPFFKDNNQELAKRLFQEALEEMEITKEELPELVVNYVAHPVHMRIAEAIQERWNQLFGLNIKLEHQDWKAHFEKLKKGNYQVGGMGWQSWLRDPSYIMQTFRDKSDGTNMCHWEDKRYQALLNNIEQEIDQKKRVELFNQAESLLMEEMPVIPIYFVTISYVKNEKLKDVFISDLSEVDFRWAYFEP